MVLSLLAGVVCAPHAGSELGFEYLSAPPGLHSVDEWERRFLAHWELEHTTSFLPASTSRDSWQFYDLSYGIDGNTAMYRATGKVQYLDRALLYVNNVVNSARDSWSLSGGQFKDVYRGWASQHPETWGQEVPLYESYCWRYVTRLLRVIRETPALYNTPRYRAQYHRLLEFSEIDIFEKWLQRGASIHIYRENTHMASHWAAIAMNLSLLTTDATRKARYLEVLNNINRSLPNHSSSLREQLGASPVNEAAFFWNDSWGTHSRPGQDVSHGNAVVAFIIEAYEAGVEWTEDDVRALTVTLDSVIWPADEQYAQYVDGSGRGDGWFNDGFMKLGRYDTHLQRRLENHSVGNNTQFYGNAALNVRLLSEKSAR
ncbi:hypothetical protein F0U61_25450 [Archangium violaceum]|uniref:hypothetical protein n=1 Tax=Archangium violaceum TaxID=83451 RepID=UPI002B28EBB5|nr:hypothetical protein F0U61_25450 [Archangium violaceum]